MQASVAECLFLSHHDGPVRTRLCDFRYGDTEESRRRGEGREVVFHDKRMFDVATIVDGGARESAKVLCM